MKSIFRKLLFQKPSYTLSEEQLQRIKRPLMKAAIQIEYLENEIPLTQDVKESLAGKCMKALNVIGKIENGFYKMSADKY